ncbi:MAG: 8-oxoguanine DNA glycosylase [Clostridiaceae bacterium]|nr:8-oxoguanine DNA glycosylase [Clostridiaceae bacterium]
MYDNIDKSGDEKVKEQTYIIENCDTFEPKDIFECGQCFRWNKQEDGSYIGIFGNNVLKVKKEDNKIIINGICIKNIEDVVKQYFDLNRDYKKIKSQLSKIDDNMKMSIKYGKGIRILNQELWETIISFIISANNNIPRIKGIIEKLSKKYGNEIIFQNKSYYTFPSVDELSRASVKDLRELGLGFRDVRVYETTKLIKEKKVDLQELKKEKDFNKVRNILLTLPGVGPKVADCILLFSTLKRWEAFPIDVWVRRVMNELYIHNPEEAKVKKEEIEKIAYEKFGELAGIAQQYLFYWKREA